MADVHTPAQRSYNMSRIRSKDTAPELRLRSLLNKAGYRFRLHSRDLPGRPDIVLPGSKVAVFVHGCFWHRHQGCRYTTMPGSNLDFWSSKFSRTIERDAENLEALERLGWTVVVTWECQLRSKPEAVLEEVMACLKPRLGSC